MKAMDLDWMKDVDRWPRALPEFDFDPETTALLIVDMQNFCARADMGLGSVLRDRLHRLTRAHSPLSCAMDK